MGEDFQFDKHIFQMGWNHQPQKRCCSQSLGNSHQVIQATLWWPNRWFNLRCGDQTSSPNSLEVTDNTIEKGSRELTIPKRSPAELPGGTVGVFWCACYVATLSGSIPQGRLRNSQDCFVRGSPCIFIVSDALGEHSQSIPNFLDENTCFWRESRCEARRYMCCFFQDVQF